MKHVKESEKTFDQFFYIKGTFKLAPQPITCHWSLSIHPKNIRKLNETAKCSSKKLFVSLYNT